MTTTDRRTIRRYAHELYPHPDEGEARPLDVEVPYLFAMAIGLDIHGTSWMDVTPRTLAGDRVERLITAQKTALLAEALSRGLTGDEAYAHAAGHMSDTTGELVWEGATHYGVPIDQIKPYPCGPEPDHHEHDDGADTWGRRVIRVNGPESACLKCTEPVPSAAVCRECGDGKHRNCDGQAWDTEADGPTKCTCPDPDHRPTTASNGGDQ